MVVVTANDEIKALLGDLRERAEIRDAKGELVGYFAPASVEAQELRRKVEADYDRAEIARRKSSGERGLTTAEVLDYLRSLDPS